MRTVYETVSSTDIPLFSVSRETHFNFMLKLQELQDIVHVSPTCIGQWTTPFIGSWATHEKITVSGVPNYLSYCEIFIAYTQFTNVITGHIIQAGRPQVGDPWYGCMCQRVMLISEHPCYKEWLLPSVI